MATKKYAVHSVKNGVKGEFIRLANVSPEHAELIGNNNHSGEKYYEVTDEPKEETRKGKKGE